MMQTTKLRMTVLAHRGVICAWFPDAPMDGKLFHGGTVAEIAKYMYRRRVRKQSNVRH